MARDKKKVRNDMEFPTIDKFAKDVAEKALDEIIYEGKTIREWVEILVKQEPCEDAISREDILDYITKLLSGYLYEEERERLENFTTYIAEMPSVTPKAEAEKEMDCEHCIHTFGTLGCCDMVDNKWVYDCDFGHEQYVKQDIYKTIDELKTICGTGTVEKAVTENNINWLKWKIDKLLSDALKEAYIKGYDYGVKDWFKAKTDKPDIKAEIIKRIEQVRDNDKNAGEYPYNRCIKIIREVLGDD